MTEYFPAYKCEICDKKLTYRFTYACSDHLGKPILVEQYICVPCNADDVHYIGKVAKYKSPLRSKTYE